jgi:hypothetical protein
MASEQFVHPLVRPRPAIEARAQLALAARWLARAAFAVTVVLSPFRNDLLLSSRPHPPLFTGYTDFRLHIGELAVMVTLALWAVSLLSRPRAISLGPGFLLWPVVGLLALILAGIPFSLDPALSAFNAGQMLLAVVFGVYALNEIPSIRSLAWPLAVMIGLQSVVAVGQLAAQHSLGLGWLGELNLDPSQAGASVVAAAGTAPLLRAYGVSDHPNILGGLLAFSLPLLVLGVPWTGRRRISYGTVTLLGLAGLFATFSRSAWIGAVVAFAIGLGMLAVRAGGIPWIRARLHPARPLVLAAMLGGAAVVVMLVPFAGFIAIRFGLGGYSVTEVMSVGERTELAGAIASIAAAHPLLGTGFATAPLALLHADPSLTYAYQPAHVVLLDVAAEVGVAAAVCYLATLVAPWLALLLTWGTWTRELAAASAALAAVTVVGFFDYYTWQAGPGRIWAWLVLALWAGAYARSRRPVRRPASPAPVPSDPGRS